MQQECAKVAIWPEKYFTKIHECTQLIVERAKTAYLDLKSRKTVIISN